MTSHLTRGVFRAIIRNVPYHSPQCPNRALLSRARCGSRVYLQSTQRRSFFGFSTGITVNQLRGPKGDEGLAQMSNLSRALEDDTRPPPIEVVVQAWLAFFSARVESPGVLNQKQVQLLLTTWRQLCEYDPGSTIKAFGTQNLHNVLAVLSNAELDINRKKRYRVTDLARRVFEKLCYELDAGGELNPETVLAYMKVLASTGAVDESLAIFDHFHADLAAAGLSPSLILVEGLSKSNQEDRIPGLFKDMESKGMRWDSAVQEKTVISLAKADNVSATKLAYEQPTADHASSMATKVAVLDLAIRKSDISWAEPIFRGLGKPTPETQDVILLWEAANGKTPEQVISELRRVIQEDEFLQETLSISCLNRLMEFASRNNDRDAVEKYFSYAEELGLVLDAQAYALLMDARATAGDYSGAVSCFQQLEVFGNIEEIEFSLLNKLVRTICKASMRTDVVENDVILYLLDHLLQRNQRLEPDTLGSLCLMQLYRKDVEGVSELLRPRIDTYTMKEKKVLQTYMTEFIHDESQPPDVAWEAYRLLRLAFPDVDIGMRTAVMELFFERKRSDLATLAFGHMRQSENRKLRPGAKEYAQCFKGIALNNDAENLHLVHNMLKLDLEVQVDTQIRNGLMLAYANCDEPEQAMSFFQDILHSEEGPSYGSIATFMHVCETYHNGVEEATKMLAKLKALDVSVTYRIYVGYVAALAGHCEFEKAAEAVRTLESRTGREVNAFVIGMFYNKTPAQYWKDQIEYWAKKVYPRQWAELEAMGYTDNEDDGLRTYHVPGLDKWYRIETNAPFSR